MEKLVKLSLFFAKLLTHSLKHKSRLFINRIDDLTLSLTFQHPHMVIGKITINSLCNFLLIQSERYTWKPFCLFALPTNVRLEIDPLRYLSSRKIRINHCDILSFFYLTTLGDRDHTRRFHLLSATDNLSSCIVYHPDQVTATITTEEFSLLHQHPFLSGDITTSLSKKAIFTHTKRRPSSKKRLIDRFSYSVQH